MPFNMAANTNHKITLLKNKSAIKYLPQMPYLSNFGCKTILCTLFARGEKYIIVT